MVNLLGIDIDLNLILPVIWFLLLIIIGWVVGKVIGFAVTFILRKKPLTLDKRMKDWKVDDAIGYASISKIFGRLAFWFVFVMFLGQASSVLNLGVLSTVLLWIVGFIPRLIIAILIALGTLIIADYVSDKIRASKSKLLDLIGIVTKIVITVFGLMMAANQIGVNLNFLMDIFKSIIQALSWGIAVAFALAIGLSYGLDKTGGRSTLPMTIEKIWRKIK